MNVKGMAYLGRESTVIQDLGEPRWRAFVESYRKRHPGFPATVLPVTKIPAEAFLDMQEALVRELYGGDRDAYWRHGTGSATYALTKGQLRGLFKEGDRKRFIFFTPQIWRGYFDEGELTTTVNGDLVDVAITGVPPHVYFEYSVIGFLHGGLQILDPGAERPVRIRGFSKGDASVLYQVRA